ncbi:MAG: BatD family protein [Bacteroidota bacterium]
MIGKTSWIRHSYRFVVALLVWITAWTVSSSAWAQQLTVNASLSETKIFEGERVALSIEISGSDISNVNRPNLPSLASMRLLSGNPSVSRNYQFINGRSSRSITYTYYYVAEEPGEHALPAIPVDVDGMTYETKSIPYTIVSRDQSSQSQQDDQRANIFMRLEVSDENPVAGQQLLANLVLYFKENVEILSYQPAPGWKAEGFWKEQLKRNERPMAQSVIMDGERYRKANLMQYALFPTRSGSLTLSPYTVSVSLRVRSNRGNNDPFSSFFGGFGTNQREIELKSEPVELDIQELPKINDAIYIGAVGRFDIQRSINTTDPLEGESIELVTRISGVGNVPLITNPQYQLPDGLERYQPQEQSNVDREGNQIVGSRTFTDILVARKAGTYTIPATTLAYYDPRKMEYQRISLDDFEITVRPNFNKSAGASANSSIPFRPITGMSSWTSQTTSSLWSHWWLWVGLALPLVIIGVGYWQKHYRDRLSSDTAFARSQFAMRHAQEKLDEALNFAQEGNIKDAYSAIQKALTGFISDRLNLPSAGLDRQDYIEYLQQQDIDQPLRDEVNKILDKAGTIQFAPTASVSDTKQDIETTKGVIKSLSKQLK